MTAKLILLRLQIALLLPLVALAVMFVPLSYFLSRSRPPVSKPLDERQRKLAQEAGEFATRLYRWKWTENFCLARCITVRLLLARLDIATTIKLGIRRLGSADLYEFTVPSRDYLAHAWLIATDGTPVITDGAARYQPVGQLD